MLLYYTSRNQISHALYHTLNKQTLRSACGFLYNADAPRITPEPQGRMCAVCQSALRAENKRGAKAASRKDQKRADELKRLDTWNNNSKPSH